MSMPCFFLSCRSMPKTKSIFILESFDFSVLNRWNIAGKEARGKGRKHNELMNLNYPVLRDSTLVPTVLCSLNSCWQSGLEWTPPPQIFIVPETVDIASLVTPSLHGNNCPCAA